MNPHLPSDSPLPSALFHTDDLPTGTERPSAEAAPPTDIHTHRLPEQPEKKSRKQEKKERKRNTAEQEA